MPIDVEGKIKNQTITDLQIQAGSVSVPQGSVGSSNEIVVVLGNGHQLKVRGFSAGGKAYLLAVDQSQVTKEDEQILD